MANINLALNFGLPTGAIAAQVAYARVDNLPSGATPTYITISPNPTSSPAVIATNVPNGQYLFAVTPVYSDLRVCNPEYIYTDSCPGLISINAYITSGQLVVQYLAPSDVPKVRITVNYPNGGSFTQNYVNNGNDIVIPFPSGVFGDFQISGQSVCDETSGFYSAPSAQVTVSRTVNNVTISNTATGITIITVNNITGFTLPQSVTAGNSVQGNHTAFYASINATFTGTPAGTSSATLSINGTIIQCVAVPNTSGGTVTFNAASVADTDIVSLAFSSGACP
jgi:hypothetical protein